MAKWTSAQRRKFKATTAAKKAAVTSIPLDAIPERSSRAQPPRASGKLQLALEVVRLLRSIIEH